MSSRPEGGSFLCSNGLQRIINIDKKCQAMEYRRDAWPGGATGEQRRPGSYLLSFATSQLTSSTNLSSPPADSTCSRYLPLTMMVGVRSTL